MRLGEEPGCTAGTEFALAGSHTHTSASAEVHQVVHIQFFEGKIHFAHCNILTFTHEAVVHLVGGRYFGCHVAMTVNRTAVLIELQIESLGFRIALRLGRARAGEGLLGGDATSVHAEFAASQIGSPFSHEAVGHEFAAGDSSESLYAIASGMVEKHNTARDAASRGVVVGGDERSHAGVGTEDAGVCKSRGEFLPLAEEEIYLVGGYFNIVDFVETHSA